MAIAGWEIVDHCRPCSCELETRQNNHDRDSSVECNNRGTISLSADKGTLSDRQLEKHRRVSIPGWRLKI
jgi:hypothetical protein